MPLIARATKTVRNKNLIILAMCVGALALFGRDGWKIYSGWKTATPKEAVEILGSFGKRQFIGYPGANDLRVRLLKESLEKLPDATTKDDEFVSNWKGWSEESAENRAHMDSVIERAKGKIDGLNEWKTVPDISVQRYIVYGLGLATAAALWWFFNCQRRRVIADDTAISPAPGIVVPWENITLIDNTRWDKVGIVQITFTDAAGKAGTANLDDYQTDREPLLQILDMLSEKAVKAKVIPDEPPENPAESPAAPKAETPDKTA